MNYEFDKEIDALLRQTAQVGGFVSTETAMHLDADEISAFAENALPEKIKQKYTLHLADCDKCRKNLSYLILLNADDSSEIVHAEEKHFIAATIPWYRKLFAFPNLAYTMGALVLVFSGISAYVILQSRSGFEGAEVTQTYEKQPNGKGMNSDGAQTATESYSSNSAMASNMMTSNTAAMNVSNSTTANFSAVPSAPMSMANSNSVMRDTVDKNLPAAPKPLSPAREPMESAKTEDLVVTGAMPAPPPPQAKENDYSMDSEAVRQQTQTQNSIAQNQAEITPDSRNVKRVPVLTQRADNKSRAADESKDDSAKKLKGVAAATTTVGGKTFKRENNVWYDSAYRGQSTVNVTRGTNEYKKLDAGLREIANNLGGTVVVTWKSKAYRIQ